jgi:hypothetical protein
LLKRKGRPETIRAAFFVDLGRRLDLRTGDTGADDGGERDQRENHGNELFHVSDLGGWVSAAECANRPKGCGSLNRKVKIG